MEPDTTQTSPEEKNVEEKVEEILIVQKPQKHFLIVFFITFSWGIFGADRFYLGKYFTGFLKLITVGGLFFWQLADFNAVLAGETKDRHGQPMAEYEQYKKFAKRFTLVFSLIALLIAVLLIAAVIFAVQALFAGFSGGGGDIQNLIQEFLPGLNIDSSLGL